MAHQQKEQGGKALFGFKWINGELVHEPEEAATYALVFDLFLVWQRKRMVANTLNQQGLRTGTDKEFTFTTLNDYSNTQLPKMYTALACVPASCTLAECASLNLHLRSSFPQYSPIDDFITNLIP